MLSINITIEIYSSNASTFYLLDHIVKQAKVKIKREKNKCFKTYKYLTFKENK